jgi:hypothetical protein
LNPNKLNKNTQKSKESLLDKMEVGNKILKDMNKNLTWEKKILIREITVKIQEKIETKDIKIEKKIERNLTAVRNYHKKGMKENNIHIGHHRGI